LSNFAEKVEENPFFVFSKNKICENVKKYKNGFDKLEAKCYLNYSIKANYNPDIIKSMIDAGKDS